MSLKKYNAKRTFEKTPEPKGTGKTTKGKHLFVVQKHHASHLHYDFRLEMEGVLKSWAVPKGPSLNPNDKRLAMMVEDHPYSYKDFEGNIPEGNYGAGNVIVWDNGTYENADKEAGDDDKKLLAALHKGHLNIVLKGKKLKGEYSLIKTHGRQENAWLLIKKKDRYAKDIDITEKEKSVISGVTLSKLAEEYGNEKTGTAKADKKKGVVKKKAAKKKPTKAGKIEVALTNQDKLYWPKEGITKGDLVNYYKDIAPVMLAYLKDRPESLHRFPNGIKDGGFFQKDMNTDQIPEWLVTEKVYSESNKEYIDYLICNNKETLLYMANLGCIEINPWNSRVQTPENPDWVVIDLDPEDIPFIEVVNAARATKKFFDSLDIDCYCKTSGATGLHIYVPLGAKYDYEIAKTFAQVTAQHVNEMLPHTTSVLRMPSKRKNKVYLDFLQNRRGQTLAAPYSVRPKPGATVSTPLDWSEVNAKLDPTKFTIKTIFKRLDKKGDLWKPVIGKGVDLLKVMKKLEMNQEK